MASMSVSAVGRALIERNEGLRLDAYPDPATGGDPWTIGYGDTGPDVVPGFTITKEEADRRLSNRLANDFGQNVNEEIGDAPTTQGQFDAMVSLAYNIGNGGAKHQHGTHGFDGSSVLREHLAGNYAAAADDFLLWNKAAGRELPALDRRRAEERALYLSDVPVAVDKSPTVSGSVDTAPAPTASSADPIVKGMEDVQRALAASGDYKGPIDADPGPGTRQAMRDYRTRVGV
jgi:lysozyme